MTGIAYSHDDKALICASIKGSITVFNLEIAADLPARLILCGNSVNTIALAPTDGHVVAGLDDGSTTIYSYVDGDVIYTFPKSAVSVFSIDVSVQPPTIIISESTQQQEPERAPQQSPDASHAASEAALQPVSRSKKASRDPNEHLMDPGTDYL